MVNRKTSFVAHRKTSFVINRKISFVSTTGGFVSIQQQSSTQHSTSLLTGYSMDTRKNSIMTFNKLQSDFAIQPLSAFQLSNISSPPFHIILVAIVVYQEFIESEIKHCLSLIIYCIKRSTRSYYKL